MSRSRSAGRGVPTHEEHALALDERDPVAAFRARFSIPRAADGGEAAYLLGNSLGPRPVGTDEAVRAELDAWARLGVEGYFRGESPWYALDERHRPAMARIVGARPEEVALMNGLTVNLHLLLATFFRPAGRRRRVLVEYPCFPSDRYAVETQLRWHGLDPAEAILEVRPREGDACLREEDLEEAMERHGGEIAVVLLGAVNFLTGQWLDVPRIAAAARRAGATLGLDLAHAAGNVPLRLHEWEVDFAAWCTYKYLNAGPGAPAGAFVHEKHAADPSLARLGGWWGNDPASRFRMQMLPAFVPRPDAAGWQLSCPPVLAFAPLGPALALFEEAGPERLRAKSVQLTRYLEALLEALAGERVDILTPREPERRGAQLSLRLRADARTVRERLWQAGVAADFREPDVVRLAPAPLFNSYHDVWRAAHAVAAAVEGD